ncbi:MAG: dTMP kinase [Magnetococcales bacterium]|nr:dTMP kinase [Magnetococcales bacterium]
MDGLDDALRRAQPGRLIAVEGGEGVGKSTQTRLLAARLRESGVSVVETREPGGCPMAERIRALLVTGRPEDLDSRAEWLLLMAARVEHLRVVIRPALARGEWVVCDRFSDSTLAYQGYGRGLPLAELVAMNRLVLGDLTPHRVVVLDLDPVAGLARAGGDPGRGRLLENRFEREQVAFHQRVRGGFLALAQADPVRFRVIDAALDPARVAAAVWEAMG